MALETVGAVLVFGPQSRMSLGPDVTDRARFSVLRAVRDHGRRDAGLTMPPSTGMKRLKRAFPIDCQHHLFHVTLPAITPGSVGLRHGQPITIVKRPRSVAVETVFPTQRGHTMGNHGRRTIVGPILRAREHECVETLGVAPIPGTAAGKTRATAASHREAEEHPQENPGVDRQRIGYAFSILTAHFL